MSVPTELTKKILPLKDVAVRDFSAENWLELGTITGCLDIVQGHRRLLRSLSFGDDDYPACVLEVMLALLEREPKNFEFIEEYMNERFETGGTNISSTVNNSRRIYFQPNVFTVPDQKPSRELIAAMMPFSGEFSPVYQAIQEAANLSGMICERADNIWQESAVIQDIFGLIFRSFIVVCDFSGKNPNVFYEAGIAHTLGKHVVPITQVATDVPFDLGHHRYVPYLNNDEGRQKLRGQLVQRFSYLKNA